MKSSVVHSSQSGVHANLAETVYKHSRNEWQQPIREHTRTAFQGFKPLFNASGFKGFILDVGCGTGQSTLQLGKQFPDKLVLGIDQSGKRLGRGVVTADQKIQLRNQPIVIGNCMLLRAEAADFMRLLSQNNIMPEKIYIFYPNPWPKPAHLLRRWHGHPVFPTLMGFGVPIELRSNWKIYLDEFAVAAGLVTGNEPQLVQIPSKELVSAFCTPFEKKYYDSGHRLWRLCAWGVAREKHTGFPPPRE